MADMARFSWKKTFKISGRPTAIGALLRAALAVCLLLLCAAPAAATVYTRAFAIDNSAAASYIVGALTRNAASNPVSTPVCTQAALQFLKHAPGVEGAVMQQLPESRYCPAGSVCEPGAAGATVPLAGNAAIDPSRQPLPLIGAGPAHPYHAGDLLFVQLQDGDRNVDPAIAERIVLTLAFGSEQERLIFTETGPDTGVFTGYIQSARPAVVPLAVGDGIFTIVKNDVLANAPIVASYDDVCETVEGVRHIEIAARALVDPFGLVFDSRTGEAIDGATVTMIDMRTGQPALVLGDDGVSLFPATVISGGSATDSGGNTYDFPAGYYRFPFIAPGTYRLDIVPPAGYSAPSMVETWNLQTLPGAPFAIEPGSRGETFVVNPGPALHIDVPLDPMLDALWVTKSVGRSTAAIGDFLLYTVTVRNTVRNTARQVVVSDRLPPGFRYRAGSTKIDGVAAADPTISADGRTLSFAVGDLPAESSAEIRLVTEIGAGAVPGKAVNLASAIGESGTSSNIARAEVLVTDDFFRAASFIAGRVFPNGCSEEQEMPGVAGVRILLEDGTYAVTDENGKYHFAAVRPGTHVVQLDLASLPETYELVACEEDSRFAGSPFSQFVDVQGGGLWRADFYLARRMMRVKGDVALELNSALSVQTTAATDSEPTAIVLHPRFESGSDRLSAEDRAQLDRIVEGLRGQRIEKLQVTGHTDAQRISPRLQKVFADNYVLSRARAARVADYLVAALGIDPALVQSAGKGPDEPVADNETPGGRARNRRVELVVTATHSTSAVVKSTGEIAFEVPLRVGEAPLRNVRLSIILPEGMSYLKGTSRLGAEALRDPEQVMGVLTYRLGNLPADWRETVRFGARVPFKGGEGEFKAQAMLTFDTAAAQGQRTPLVENVLARRSRTQRLPQAPIVLHPRFESGRDVLSADDKALLDGIAAKLKGQTIETLQVTGHTDAQRISERLQAVYPDNHALSVARATSVARYLAAALKLPPERIVTEGKGPDAPLASNATAEGMAQNRRVELLIAAVAAENASFDLESIKDRSGSEAAAFDATVEWQPAETLPERGAALADPATNKIPDFDKAWLDRAAPGLAFVWPPEGYYPSVPVVKVAVKHDPLFKLTLFLNGEPVDPFYLDGTRKRSDLLVALSEWFGVSVKEGANRLEAVQYDRNGIEAGRVALNIHYSSPPVKAELAAEQPDAVADGKTPAVIAVRLIDKDGHPARPGVVGEFRVDPPYIPYQRTLDAQKQPLTTSTSTWTKYRVGENGIARIELQPTTQTGEAVLRFNLVNGEQEIRSWLAPAYRDWILVGLAEGTVGYNEVTGNMESLGAAGEDTDYYDEGRIAFYAKGQVKGEWLLTMAYDSGKKSVDGRQGLYQTVDPNQYYLLYGDKAEQYHDAASAKKIYVRIERSQFYALFGDYATGMTVTELARYSRNLTGFKSEMKGERFAYTLFAADTSQAYVKDELRGDGTSGLYRLSRRDIVLNSDIIAIETRDRFRSEVVLDRQELLRHLDYTIDYEAGTIFFKAPVFSRDENFNPIYIVAEYESYDSGDTAWTYGGRGAVRLLDERVEAGATYVHEGATGGEADLLGADLTLFVTPETKVRAEVATTDSDRPAHATEPGGEADVLPGQGTAWLAEVQHQSAQLDGILYIREQEEGFGLGQQRGSETGTRKIGGDVNYRLTDALFAGLGLLRQENLATDAVREVAEVRGNYTTERFSLLGGLRHAEDNLDTGEDRRSEQIFAGLTWRFSQRLSVTLQHDQSLYANENVDFPTRTLLGADYRWTENTTFFAAQEWTHGDSVSTEMTRLGMRTSPWTGGQISSSLEQQATENGTRLFAVSGLKQTWQLTERWSVDAGLDRSETLRETKENYDFNSNVPPASGGSDSFTAISLGAGYLHEDWSWTGRVENRDAKFEDRFSVFTGANGDIRPGLALAGSFQTFITDAQTGKTANYDLRLGVAYRPLVPRTIFLDRLEYLEERVEGGTAFSESRRLVNNFVANVRAGQRTMLSLQYGAKYVTETIDGDVYSGFTDLIGVEGRYDITSRWDAGVRGSVLHSWRLDQYEYASGVSVGYSPAKNVWLSGGYNFTGFRDDDFSRADFTAQGPYIKLRLKFDQVSVREAVKWYNGQ